AAFVWWRLSAQQGRIEEYWSRPLSSSAQGFRTRAEEWLTAQRHAAEVLGALAARGRTQGSAFEVALGAGVADGDLAFASLRDGQDLLRCDGVPLADHCGPGSTTFVIPSPDHPQAHRLRPIGEGRALIAAVGVIPPHEGSSGGVVTLWLDPERSLLPRLAAT